MRIAQRGKKRQRLRDWKGERQIDKVSTRERKREQVRKIEGV